MSRTIRKHKFLKDGFGVHRPGMGHKSIGKYAVGPGGLNCSCCTKLPPEEMKIKERRLERRSFNQSIFRDMAEE